MKLTERHGTFDQFIVWTDNAPSQFKDCFFFFYLNHLVQNKYFLRIDLKFLLEGHNYSTCDRRFACVQQFYDTHRGAPRLSEISYIYDPPIYDITSACKVAALFSREAPR